MQYKEKRHFIRLRAYHLAKYKLISAEKKDAIFLLTTIQDIGAGGVRLVIEEPLPASTLIELKINFPPLDTPISTLAKIAWIKQIGKTKRYEAGAQFVEIDESLRNIIDGQVKSVQKRVV